MGAKTSAAFIFLVHCEFTNKVVFFCIFLSIFLKSVILLSLHKITDDIIMIMVNMIVPRHS